MPLSKPVADALRNLLAQANFRTEEEAALGHQCFVEIRENEAPIPVIDLGTVDSPEPTQEAT